MFILGSFERKARNGFPISVDLTFFARWYDRVATSDKTSKIGDFASTQSVWSKILGAGGRPHQSFLHEYLGQWMPYHFAADSFHTWNFVADFLQAKCYCRRKSAVLRFRAPLGAEGQRTVIILGSLESA